MSKQERPQQEFLQAAKTALGLTWDELAEQAGIAPRALKNYRMPDDSQNHRSMPSLARRAIQQLLDAQAKKNRRNLITSRKQCWGVGENCMQEAPPANPPV
jgi:transcriptional regulator with XRE-family HTH domain